MTKLYNSVFEMQLRILLLLSQTRRLLSKDEIVSMETIIKICECLNCRIEDVVELVPEGDHL